MIVALISPVLLSQRLDNVNYTKWNCIKQKWCLYSISRWDQTWKLILKAYLASLSTHNILLWDLSSLLNVHNITNYMDVFDWINLIFELDFEFNLVIASIWKASITSDIFNSASTTIQVAVACRLKISSVFVYVLTGTWVSSLIIEMKFIWCCIQIL